MLKADAFGTFCIDMKENFFDKYNKMLLRIDISFLDAVSAADIV